MISEIVAQWDKNKHSLENYFKKTRQEEYDSYEAILEKIIDIVLNEGSTEKYDSSNIDIETYGEYEGDQVMVFRSQHHTIQTEVSYGSCSGCDTLLRISNYEEDIPSEDQVLQYMTLSLHLIQQMEYI